MKSLIQWATGVIVDAYNLRMKRSQQGRKKV